MRFASLLGLACLTATTFAAPTKKAHQDTIAVIERGAKNISNNLKGLTSAIRDLDSSSRRGQDTSRQQIDIERRAGDVTNALRDSTNQVRRNRVLTTIEATSTISIVDDLAVTTQRTVDAWITAKPSIVRAGGRQAVLGLLAAQEVANDEFVDALIAKMPLASVPPAKHYGQRARNQLDLAIAAFKRP